MELLKTELVEGNPPELQIVGEVDLSTVDALRIALQDALDTDPTVVIDMAGVTFIDAVGLHTVLSVAAGQNGAGPLQLVNAPRVTWLLDLVGMNDEVLIVVGGEGERGVR
jgi:anti-anti-sigma factor